MLDLHADVLPDFYRECSLGEIVVQLADRVRSEVRIFKLVGIKCRAQGHVAVTCTHQSQRVCDLRRKLPAVRSGVVHDQDVQNLQVEMFE